MYGVSYGRLPLFKVCGGASPSCRRNPLALGRGGSQIHSLFVVAVKATKSSQDINIEHIHAMYALGMNKTNENYDLLNKLQHIINDLDYFTGLVRKNTATQLSAFESIRHQVPALS